jgi:uncharacterized membrane protein YfcA
MIHTFIGLTVGIIMGLTGAGGALISIPLFISLLNSSLKEATVLSLIAVLSGTLINLFSQKYKLDKKIVMGFVVFGAISNYATLPLKFYISDIVIALLLTCITAYSLWSIWGNRTTRPLTQAKPNMLKLIGTGLFLGLVTTMTGLGGGVLLVPILIIGFGKTYEEALPTSLATIFFISLISFLLQMKAGLELITPPEIGLIALGSLIGFLVLKLVLSKIANHKIEMIRKTVFTLVTLYSISSVLLKSF